MIGFEKNRHYHRAKPIYAAIFALFVFSVLVLDCKATVEIGESYVMYDLRQYDGDSALPFGKGSNANCYYPRKDGSDYVFPELYTWSYATLTETYEGVRLHGTKSGTQTSITVDKVPQIYQQSVQRNFHYFVTRIKANTKIISLFFSHKSLII